MKRKEKNEKEMLKHKRLLNKCFHGSKKTMKFIEFFFFVPMELEKDGEEMKRKSTVTIPEKQEFKADP